MSTRIVFSVTDLRDHNLFRAFISYLWATYDSGGISVGRSIQSSLLESFMDLHPVEIPAENIDGSIEREIKSRIRCKTNSQKREQGCPTESTTAEINERLVDQWLPFSELCTLSDSEFTLFVLIELKRWYIEESVKMGFHNKTHEKMVFILYEFFFLCHPEIPTDRFIHLTNPDRSVIQDIIDEGRSRSKIKSDPLERFRNFKDFGIKPFQDIL